MLTIYYHPFSFPSLSSLFTASALGLEFESKVVDLQAGENQGEAYKAINPMGRVPAVKDGEFCLGESGAIMRYLAGKAGSPLYPDNIQDRAQIDHWIDYISHHVRAAVARIQFNRVLAPMIGVDVDEGSIATGLQFLERNLPPIEVRLAKHDYVHGESLTLADIALVSALEPIEMAKIDISPYPALRAWLTKQRQEDYYTQVHSHFGAELGL